MSYGWEEQQQTERIPVVAAPTVKPRATANIAAIVAATCAVIGLVIIPVVMAPAAVIAGIVGLTLAQTRPVGGGTLSVVAGVAGMVEIFHMVVTVLTAVS